MDKESFELERCIVEWLMRNGCEFRQAMAIVSYSRRMNITIAEAYFDTMLAKFTVGELSKDLDEEVSDE